MDATLKTLIAGHPFLAGLDPQSLHHFEQCATLERYGVGQEIFCEGQSAERFYLIHRGRVAVETFVPGVGNKTIQTIGAGEALGCSWLFPPHTWHFAARSVDASELIAFEGEHLREKAHENPVFRAELVERVANVLLKRLHATRLQLVDFYADKQ